MDILDSSKLVSLERKVCNLVRDCGDNLKQTWNQDKLVTFKADAEPVTEYDIKTERNLRERLHELMPDAGFLVEEGENTAVKPYMWLVDPIDQTKNFIGQIPIFYVQLALTHENTPLLGVIYNPVSEQLFSASRGNKARLNGKNLALRKFPILSDSVIDVEFGGNQEDNLEWKLDKVRKLARVGKRVRLTGGAYAPYVLTGGIDVYISVNERTRIMDQVPRIILMKEAGMRCEQFMIEERIVTLAASKEVFEEVVSVISS